jgi:hypothetical protein
MLSGAAISRSPIANFTPFDLFAKAMNCTEEPGPQRIACLQEVPAEVIKNITNFEPNSLNFENPVVDK